MAEEQLSDNVQSTEESMELDAGSPIAADPKGEADGTAKRAREDGEAEAEAEAEAEDSVDEEGNGVSKKRKVDSSFEEHRMESLGDKGKDGNGDGEGEKNSGPVSIGPKVFGSPAEMSGYFSKLLRSWSPDLHINKYEHMVLHDLIKKGHADPERKIGAGIKAFLVHKHPEFNSLCFFLERVDGSSDDFSFSKCINNIFSLPENMKIKAPEGKNGFSNKEAYGRGHGGRGRGRRGGYRK